MSAVDTAALRAEHRRVEPTHLCCAEGACTGHADRAYCDGCGADWPCVPGALIAQIDAMVVGAVHGRRWLDEMRAQRDRARDAAAALEAENAELRTALEAAEASITAAENAGVELDAAVIAARNIAGVALARTDPLRAET
jgi:hypothetical protein